MTVPLGGRTWSRKLGTTRVGFTVLGAIAAAQLHRELTRLARFEAGRDQLAARAALLRDVERLETELEHVRQAAGRRLVVDEATGA